MADKPIARAARIRAAIVALMQTAREPATIQQMQRHPSIQQLDATVPQVTSVVADMYKQGKLKRVYIALPDEPNTKYAYERPKEGEKPVAAGAARVTLPPDVRLDIIKSSGRLRIEFRGLRVEIGAID